MICIRQGEEGQHIENSAKNNRGGGGGGGMGWDGLI